MGAINKVLSLEDNLAKSDSALISIRFLLKNLDAFKEFKLKNKDNRNTINQILSIIKEALREDGE